MQVQYFPRIQDIRWYLITGIQENVQSKGKNYIKTTIDICKFSKFLLQKVKCCNVIVTCLSLNIVIWFKILFLGAKTLDNNICKVVTYPQKLWYGIENI